MSDRAELYALGRTHGLKAQEAESLNYDFQQLMGARFPSQGS